ncbi:coiled-coil domain-containing protein 157 [Aulostomus maculatus]
MSQFLGSQDCIDSLRKDLVDLQGVVLDVFSRTGPVRFSSWKFPDKLSCNLDMVALLEQYDFVEGEDVFNQHSHIVLLELVIDRLLLLLQSFNTYVDQLRREQPQQKGCLSIGLVVLTYWSNLIQFGNEVCKENKKKTQMLDCDESETVSSRNDSSTRFSSSSIKFSPQKHAPSSPTPSTPCHPKADTSDLSCQTVESSLLPCSACHQLQAVLRKTGGALVELFQGEGLPSSLQPLLKGVEDTVLPGQMTAGDVAHWAGEQHRDMRRLAKHLQDVRDTVQPLTERLAAAEAERETFESKMKSAQREVKQEVEIYKSRICELELSLQKAQRSVEETEKRLAEEQEQLKREISTLEEINSALKEKVEKQQDVLQALEFERDALQETVRSLQEGACRKLQEKIQQSERHISETQLLLDKENAKYQSACRQQESMQAKQRCLLARVDALDEECEELQRQLGQKEEREINLHDRLQQMSEEKEQLRAQLAPQQVLCLQLQKEKETLETHVGALKTNVAELEEYVRSSKERERLLVAFPELSPLAHTQPQSTGDVLLDMEQQLQANCIRIRVLEQENTALRNSLVRLRERSQLMEGTPQQTWGFSVPRTPEENQQTVRSPAQSSSSALLVSSNRAREERGGERGLQSAGAGSRLSGAATSPSSRQIYLQTLHLNTGSAAPKTSTRPHRNSFFSKTRSLKQRKT